MVAHPWVRWALGWRSGAGPGGMHLFVHVCVCAPIAGGFSGFAEGSIGAKADACFSRKTKLLADEGVRLRRAGGGGGGITMLAGGTDAATGAPLTATDAVVTAADFAPADIAAAVALLSGAV